MPLGRALDMLLVPSVVVVTPPPLARKLLKLRTECSFLRSPAPGMLPSLCVQIFLEYGPPEPSVLLPGAELPLAILLRWESLPVRHRRRRGRVSYLRSQ